MNDLKLMLVAFWSAPLYAMASRDRSTIERDAHRFASCLAKHHMNEWPSRKRFGYLVATLPEFRSLVHYRLRRRLPLPVRILLRKLYQGEPTLHIETEHIGPGLFIQHGFATTITAERIGEDCWINQQVTIGHTAKGKPTIGDNVMVTAGAYVVGPIKVGDGVTIGANALVRRDVPSGATMVGPEAIELALP